MNLPAALPRIVGAKLPLRPMHVWTIRVRLQIERRVRDLALFDIALDSKLRGCDVVALRVADIIAAGALRRRATVIQQKTGRPVQFEITEQTRRSLADWLKRRRGEPDGWVFPSRMHPAAHLSTRQYIRLVKQWVGTYWAGACCLWKPQLTAHQGFLALSQDGQPESLSAAPGPYQAGEHGSLSGSGVG
jgi:integrase